MISCLSPWLWADEAILPDGRKLTGKVQVARNGRVTFAGKDGILPLADLHRLRFAPAAAPAWRAAVLHRVHLADGQQLTGELLEWNADTLRLRTAWSELPLAIPRGAVEAITHQPGFVTVFDDDFEADLKPWKLTGEVATSDKEHHSGKHSLLLGAPGQAAEYVLPAALDAGRLGINFLDSGETSGAGWLVEAEFAHGKGVRLATVVPSRDGYTVQVPGADEVLVRLVRQRGWQRLTIEFSSKALRFFVDDQVLATSEPGPGGALRAVRLRCVKSDDKAAAGKAWFDDFSLARSIMPPRRPSGDLGQDELMLVSGDQLFGSVLSADRRTIEMEGRFGRRTFRWADVYGIYPRQQQTPGRSTDGEQVRVWLRADGSADFDRLDGAVVRLDKQVLKLAHPTLGEVAIDYPRLEQVQGLFHGRRIELDNALHHLGRRMLPAAPVPQPEGLVLRARFTLEVVPDDARLVLQAAYLKGSGDGPKIKTALERGGLRTDVELNGKVVDYLNHHAERSAADLHRLSIRLPRAILKVGENVVELRQTMDRDSGQYEDCMIGGLVIELPR